MQRMGMFPFGSCEQDGLRCSHTSRFLSRFPESLPIGAITQSESLPPERLKVFFHCRDASKGFCLEEDTESPQDVKTQRFRPVESPFFVHEDKVSASLLGQDENFAFTIPEEKHGADALRGLWLLQGNHLQPPRSNRLLGLLSPSPFPTLYHDLAIHRWR